MRLWTTVKIFLTISLCLIGFAIMFADGGGEAISAAVIFLILAVPFGLSANNDIKKAKFNNALKEKEIEQNKKNISLTRKILNVAASQQKALSIYDFMIRIQESEELIQNELNAFVKKGIAQVIVNEKGLTLYNFSLITSDDERKDILQSW